MHVERLKNCDDTDLTCRSVLANGRAPNARILDALRECFRADLSADQVKIAPMARANKYDIVHVGDVVAVGPVGSATRPLLGRIDFLAWVNDEGGGEGLAVLQDFAIKEDQKRCWKCRRRPDPIVVFARDISCACVWAGEDVVTVLKPLHAALWSDI